MRAVRKGSLLGVMPSSRLSALSLSHKTCPLGLLAVLGSSDEGTEGLVYNEEVSGDILEDHRGLWDGADAILLSAHAGNIGRSLVLARTANAENKRVILGGPEPSMIGPRLLCDHPYVDALVVGPGESVLSELLTDAGGSVPPGVFYPRHASSAGSSEHHPAYRSIDFQNVRVDYSQLVDLGEHKGLSYFWGNDCAQARKRCFFCGRMSMGVGYRPPARVWSELLWAYRRGVRSFYNTTDSVTTSISGFSEFCAAKPAEMGDDSHRVFVNSRDVNDELISGLRRLRGTAVIGIESFGSFGEVNKHCTSDEDNLRAVEMVYAAGVGMVLSFVLGLPGETPESIEVTERGIERTVERYGGLIDAIHLSPLLITTGSPAYYELMSDPEVRAKYETRPVPYDVVEMSSDYFSRRCHVSRAYCIERAFSIARRVRAMAPHIRIGAKGILKSEEQGLTEVPAPGLHRADDHVRLLRENSSPSRQSRMGSS